VYDLTQFVGADMNGVEDEDNQGLYMRQELFMYRPSRAKKKN